MVCLAEVQCVADLLGIPATDVTQRDHLALARREVPDRLQQHIARLVRLQLGLRVLPGHRRAGPPTRAFPALALEAIRVERRASPLLVAAPEQSEWQDPALPRAARARLVEGDAGEPGAQHRATLEAVEAVERRKPRVLDHLLGDRPARHVHHHQAHEERPVFLDQGPERVLVSAAEPLEKRCIGVGRRSRALRSPRAFLLRHRSRFSHAPREA